MLGNAEDQASRLSAAADEADRSARDPDDMARQEPPLVVSAVKIKLSKERS